MSPRQRHRHRPTHGTARQYPRTARLNVLVQEIVAEELERIDDDRLDLVTVTAVDGDPDLRNATVWFTTLGPAAPDVDADRAVLDALGEARVRLQAAIGRQARTKRVPHLRFRPDAVERQAQRIEDILRAHPLALDDGADDTP